MARPPYSFNQPYSSDQINTALAANFDWLTTTMPQLSSLTAGTKGDLIVTDGTTRQSLAVGANTYQLFADSTPTVGLKWAPGLFVGQICQSATSAAPAGWLLCDGSTVSRTTYAALFAAIGTTYGAGDGSTTFALPDLRGRVPVGLDNMDNSVGTGGGDAGRLAVANTLGGSGGEETHVLTTAELAAHTHGATGLTATQGTHSHKSLDPANTLLRTSWPGGTGGDGTLWKVTGTTGTAFNPDTSTVSAGAITMGGNTASSGSDTAHNNMQPYLLINHVIYAGV